MEVRVLAPLRSGSTYRGYVHLLLGAVVALPYAAVAWLFGISFAAGLDPVGGVVLLLVAVVAGVGVTLVPGVRALEIAAARALLDAEVPVPEPGGADGWLTRRRAALWLLVVAVAGSVTALATLTIVPVTVGLIIAPWRSFAPLPSGWAAAWAPVAGLVLPVALLYGVAAAVAGLQRLAPRLLGPSAIERLTALMEESRVRERVQTERARLARELHDSVGHALTVTTLQAGAAARVLDTDRAFVRTALEAIAEAGRSALEDLDHVLGLLRDTAPASRALRPVRGLADLANLVAGVRAAGIEVITHIDGDLDAVPGAVSRAAYRIVQESVTNAARHAVRAPVTVRVAVDDGAVEIEVGNPITAGTGVTGGGRGLAGLRERVRALHGVIEAGGQHGVWRVHARLPLAR